MMTDEQKLIVQGALVDADHLATCCEEMLAAMNRYHVAVERGEVVDEADTWAHASAMVDMEQAEAEVCEYLQAILSAACEYRKRAELARSALAPDSEVTC